MGTRLLSQVFKIGEHLAYLLFSSLQEGQHHVKVKINDWSEVNVLMDFNPTNLSSTQVPVPPS